MRILSATGQLGTGYSVDSLERAVRDGVDAFGVDGGTSDSGAYFLGSGETKASAESLTRDLEPLIVNARKLGVPLLVGSAGTAGADSHVEKVISVVEDIARRNRLHFDLGVIKSDVSASELHDAHGAHRLHALGELASPDEALFDRFDAIVAQLGAEHFDKALSLGADVIIAGRATDAAIFSSVAMRHGIAPGLAWHAGKLLECGAASAAQRTHPDCMVVEFAEDTFVIRPPNPSLICTPQSVSAQSLYENAHPFEVIEPSGVLSTEHTIYDHAPDRGVRVRGSQFLPKPRYDFKLEAAILRGFRTIAYGTIRDPKVLGRLTDFLDSGLKSVRRKIGESVGLSEEDYSIRVLPGDLTSASLGAEVSLLFEITAQSQALANAACAVLWHTLLHHPIPEWHGLISNLAFPFSPPHIATGPVYEFGLNAVIEPDDANPIGTVELRRI